MISSFFWDGIRCRYERTTILAGGEGQRPRREKSGAKQCGTGGAEPLRYPKEKGDCPCRETHHCAGKTIGG